TARQKLLAEIDAADLIPTPANTSYLGLVYQAMRESIQEQGMPVVIDYDRGVTSYQQGLGGVKTAFFHAQGRFGAVDQAGRQDAQGVDQAIVIESPVRDPRVIGVAEQVIHPVGSEGITDNDLSEDGFPGGERNV